MIKTVCRKFLTVILSLSMAAVASAQVSNLPVTKINGKIYYYYKVEPKESIYSLQHKLGVSKDDIILNNPAAAEGIKAGMILYFPFDTSDVDGFNPTAAAQTRHETAPAPAAAPDGAVTHTVRPGETVYGLSKRYGLTEDQLRAMNPQLTDVLKAGETIVVGMPKGEQQTTAKEAPAKPADEGGYVVKKHETFYSIARDHGITSQQLEAANPGISVLKEGMVLTIPSAAAMFSENSDKSESSENSEHSEISENSQPAQPAEPVEVVEAAEPQDINIALILPFMLNQEPIGKQAQRFTEFYKGFLIATDSLRNCGRPINIRAYDSASSIDTVRNLLATDTMLRHMDIIIAPENPTELEAVGQFGRLHDIDVFNAFVVKDDSYMTNPFMLQTNIPSEQMYEKAAEGFMRVRGDYVPVFVRRRGAAAEKTEFVAELEKRFKENDIIPMNVEFDNRLTGADLADLNPMGNYIFIPVTGRQTEVSKVLTGIAQWRDNHVTPGVKVWGFPEWTTYKGDLLETMHSLNTTVYSRFLVDENSYRNRDFDRKFKQWYGTEIENAVPRQGVLGFDSGMWIIRTMMTDGRRPDAIRYQGIQNDFNFVPVEGGGWVNSSLSLINYRPGGSIEKTSL